MDELNGIPRKPPYRPGDTIEMDVEISHRERIKLKSVEVRFQTEGTKETYLTEFVLTGDPHPMDETRRSRRTSPEETVPEYTQWSIARVKEEVSLRHAPGIYELLSIGVVTASGLEFQVKSEELELGLFDSSFEVVRPSGRPEIMRGRFVS